MPNFYFFRFVSRRICARFSPYTRGVNHVLAVLGVCIIGVGLATGCAVASRNNGSNKSVLETTALPWLTVKPSILGGSSAAGFNVIGSSGDGLKIGQWSSDANDQSVLGYLLVSGFLSTGNGASTSIYNLRDDGFGNRVEGLMPGLEAKIAYRCAEPWANTIDGEPLNKTYVVELYPPRDLELAALAGEYRKSGFFAVAGISNPPEDNLQALKLLHDSLKAQPGLGTKELERVEGAIGGEPHRVLLSIFDPDEDSSGTELQLDEVLSGRFAQIEWEESRTPRGGPSLVEFAPKALNQPTVSSANSEKAHRYTNVLVSSTKEIDAYLGANHRTDESRLSTSIRTPAVELCEQYRSKQETLYPVSARAPQPADGGGIFTEPATASDSPEQEASEFPQSSWSPRGLPDERPRTEVPPINKELGAPGDVQTFCERALAGTLRPEQINIPQKTMYVFLKDHPPTVGFKGISGSTVCEGGSKNSASWRKLYAGSGEISFVYRKQARVADGELTAMLVCGSGLEPTTKGYKALSNQDKLVAYYATETPVAGADWILRRAESIPDAAGLSKKLVSKRVGPLSKPTLQLLAVDGKNDGREVLLHQVDLPCGLSNAL